MKNIGELEGEKMDDIIKILFFPLLYTQSPAIEKSNNLLHYTNTATHHPRFPPA